MEKIFIWPFELIHLGGFLLPFCFWFWFQWFLLKNFIMMQEDFDPSTLPNLGLWQGCWYVPNVSIISACSMHVLCDFAMFCLNFHTLFIIFALTYKLSAPSCQFQFSAIFIFQVFRPLKVPNKFRKNYIKNQRPGSWWYDFSPPRWLPKVEGWDVDSGNFP